MATYRYLFADLLTNTINAELPLSGVTFTQALNQAGTFTGHLQLSDIRIKNTLGTYFAGEVFTLDSDTATGKTALYIERDGILVWGGIIWSRTYDSTSQTMTFSGREFESYFERRRITSTVVFPSTTDQFTMIKNIVDTAQSAASGNIGINTGYIGLSGVTIGTAYPIFAYERRVVFDTILNMSQQASPLGFDFSVDVAYDANYVPTKTLNLYYPRKGVAYSSTSPSPMLEFPGSMVAYSYPEDGGSMANKIYGAGAGSNEGQYLATASSAAALTAGYPLLEDSVSYTQIPNPTVVDKLTTAEVNARYQPVTVLQASWVPTVNPVTGVQVAPVWGDFNLGDTFRIRITDDRFPNTLETTLRLRSFDVRVGDDGSAEMITGKFVVSTY